MNFKYILKLNLLFLVCLMGSNTASAANLAPAVFKGDVSPWCSTEYQLEILNTDSNNAPLNISYADVPDFLIERDADKDASTGIGDWVSVSKNRVVLNPGETDIVTVSIEPAQDIKSGKYYGLVMVEGVNSSGASGLGHVINLDVATELQANTDVVDFDITHSQLSFDEVMISVKIENTEDLPVESLSAFSVEVVNMFGYVVDEIDISSEKKPAVCPGEVSEFLLNWNPGVLSFGLYTFKLKNLERSTEIPKETTFILTPLGSLVVILIVVSLALIIRRIVVRVKI
ncbi:MAG: hypothetical protein ACI9H6_000147 [Patiriisocius sp.]|jgi:hypothetical protein